jgi:serine/threonine-protein kinase
LAAALAAGELPSPELVAASGGTDSIRIATAVSLFAFVLAALVVITYMAKWRYAVNHAGVVKPPDVLVDNAREIIRENLGYQYEPEDSAFDFVDRMYGGGTELRFWYRQRETANLQNFHFFNESEQPTRGRPTFQIPAWLTDNELGLITDSTGRLRFFRAIPPVELETQEIEENKHAWSQWFPPAVIGYVLLDESDPDPSGSQQEYPSLAVAPDLRATTPDASDTTRVWKGNDEFGEVTVVAAAFGGRPVYFEVLHESDPDHDATRFAMQLPDANRALSKGVLSRTLVNLMIVAAGVIAWFHLRSGRGDRIGALRAALVVGGLFIFASLGIAHRLSPASALFPLFGQTLVYAFIAWIVYIAMEPLVRRVWPQALITWTRLIQGNWRDPMVSRSILAGIVALILLELHNSLGYFVVSLITPAVAEMSVGHRPLMLAGTPELFGMVAANVPYAIFVSFLLLFLILGVRLAARKDSIAFVVLVVLACTLWTFVRRKDLDLDLILINFYYMAVVLLVYMLVLSRFGLLALVTFHLVLRMLRSAPLTLDSQAWYYGHAMFFLGLVCLLVLVACYNAVDLQKIGTSSHSPVTE